MTDAAPTLTVSRRQLAVVLAALLLAAAGSHWLPAESGWSWALKVVVPALAVAVLPGAALTLLVLRRACWSAIELLVISAGISLVTIQLLVIAAMVLHVGPQIVLTGAACAVALMLARSSAGRAARRPVVIVTRAELVVVAGLAVAAFMFFLQGSPWELSEDSLHLGVIRRLSRLDAPRLDNIYFAPGVIYTYPFPAIHYLVALVSALGDVDAIFAYHKLRFLWAVLAISSVSVFGRYVFTSVRIGIACAWTALAFVAAGTFTNVPPLMWGQLAPVSHASDVAMGVILPVTLVFVAGTLRVGSLARRRFLLAGTLGLVLVLSVVHVRELVQLLVYLLAFALFLLWQRTHRRLMLRTWGFFAAALAVSVAFLTWHRSAVTHISALVDSYRAQLVHVITTASPLELLGAQLPMMSSFVVYYSVIFQGWNPVLLAAVPIVTILFARRPLVWFMTASVFVYLLIVRYPLFAAPYIYATYFEILFTPIRNVIFFLFVVAGAAACVIAGRLSTLSMLQAAATTIVGVVLVRGLWTLPRDFLERHQDALIVPVVVALGLLIWRARHTSLTDASASNDAPHSPRSAWLLLVGACVVATAGLAITWQRTAVPAPAIHIAWRPTVGETSRVLHEFAFGLSNPERLDGGRTWSYDLVDDSTRNVLAILRSPAVADTQDLDRDTPRVSPDADPGDTMRWAGNRIPIFGMPSGVQVTLVTLIGIAAWAFRRAIPRRRQVHQPLEPPARRYAFVLTLLLTLVAGATWRAETSPFTSLAASSSPQDLLPTRPCRDLGMRPAPYLPPGVAPLSKVMVSCVPPLDLMRWFDEHVPVNAVLAVNIWNMTAPSVYLPQQYLGWAGVDNTFLNPDQIFGAYLGFYHRSLTRYAEAPFFNDRETDEERREFVRALGASHILVDPSQHATMSRVLDGRPGYERLYDRDGWAVYRVS